MSYYERNRQNVYRRSTEYNLKNKEEIKEYQRNYFKQYYQDHKDEILHRLRDYYDKNIRTNQVRKDKISSYKKSITRRIRRQINRRSSLNLVTLEVHRERIPKKCD